eukprot:TRINITY_DN10819_c0_g1_i4.p1 TRINITY_DN10819_c0_g1~~TRINITY_DN10819_c0_g1_i4.p1  ORF type:complete len:198 (+),score=41.83 TRINITY_DN10819_c0_g1_i4:81-674(+)
MSTPKLPRLASISRQSSSGSTVEQGLDRVEKLDKKLKKIAAKEKQVKQQRAQPAESDAKDTFFLTQIDADKQKSPTDAGAAGEAALTRAAGVLSASERHRLRHLLQEIDHLSEEELSQESALAPHLSELQAIDAKLQALRPGHTVTVLDDARTLHGESSLAMIDARLRALQTREPEPSRRLPQHAIDRLLHEASQTS